MTLIQIKRTMAFGDVLWTEPLVRYFLQQGLHVNLSTDYPEAFKNYPSNKFSVNKNEFLGGFFKLNRRFLNLDMAYELNPGMHILEAYRNAAGLSDMELSYPRLFLSEKEKKRMVEKKYIVLHIDRNPLNFRNIYSINWNNVISYLENKGYIVVQISKNGENIHGQWIKTRTFREVMSIINHCHLFIGVDSGPSHIAASLGIPSILFFGSVNPAYRHLKRFNGIFLQGDCEYAHCYHEVPGCSGQPCRFVGGLGIPKCCVQTDEKLIAAIEKLVDIKV